MILYLSTGTSSLQMSLKHNEIKWLKHDIQTSGKKHDIPPRALNRHSLEIVSILWPAILTVAHFIPQFNGIIPKPLQTYSECCLVNSLYLSLPNQLKSITYTRVFKQKLKKHLQSIT